MRFLLIIILVVFVSGEALSKGGGGFSGARGGSSFSGGARSGGYSYKPSSPPSNYKAPSNAGNSSSSSSSSTNSGSRGGGWSLFNSKPKEPVPARQPYTPLQKSGVMATPPATHTPTMVGGSSVKKDDDKKKLNFQQTSKSTASNFKPVTPQRSVSSYGGYNNYPSSNYGYGHGFGYNPYNSFGSGFNSGGSSLFTLQNMMLGYLVYHALTEDNHQQQPIIVQQSAGEKYLNPEQYPMGRRE